jgi:outer membrane protein assembly factor BamB
MGDYGRTNFYDGATPAVPPQKSWSVTVAGLKVLKSNPRLQHSSPVEYGGALYVGSANNGFYAVNLNTGDELWSFDSGSPIDSTPTVNEEMACFGTTGGLFYCLDRVTGREIFSFQANAEILSSPIIKDGIVYFITADKRLYALNMKTGEKLWTYTHKTKSYVTSRLLSSPAASDDKLFVLFSDGVLVALDMERGRELWKREMLTESVKALKRGRRTPLYRDGLVYALDDAGRLIAMSAESGETKIVYDVADTVDFAVSDDSVYIAGPIELVSLDKATGETRWAKSSAKGEIASILATKRHVYAFSNKDFIPFDLEYLTTTWGYVQAYSVPKGTLQWTEKFGSTVTANASAIDGRIAVLIDKGSLIVYADR